MVDTLAERATVPDVEVGPPDLEVRPPSSPPRRRVNSVLLLLAIAAGIGTLILPWFDLSLDPSLRAFDLSPGLARLQFPSVISYGAIISVVLVVAVTFHRPSRLATDGHVRAVRLGASRARGPLCRVDADR